MYIQLGEASLVIVLCIALGGLPLVGWIVQAATGKDLSEQGTGNVSVAAAFQQVGVPVGILAALAGIVIGRYRYGGSAGSTNVFWGLLLHAPVVTAATAAVGGVGYGLVRRPRFWQYAVLVLFCGGMALRSGDQPGRVGIAIILCLLLAWVYHRLPNDVAQGDPLQTLDQSLKANQAGQKAATLSELKRAGYPVAEGWAIPKGDDLQSVLDALDPSEADPLIVRSSAVGEDQLGASAAGQYETIANVTSREDLSQAIDQCFASYDEPSAVRYRQGTFNGIVSGILRLNSIG